jgi:ABC-2 type transport system ATP-binding protein
MPPSAIEVSDLQKKYADVHALQGVSFAVSEGEVFGLLGPNGAGKTSTIEILEGLRTGDSGRVSVLGMDPRAGGDEFRQRVGAVLQATALPDKLRVSEAISLFANFYPRHRKPDELLARFQLEEKRNAFYSHLSGGQKQRLALALAIVNDPELMFLDEPTAGLDPQARREIYSIIEELRSEKKTILLTTHYIEEAERLCDRVAIVDHGRVIAMGTPQELRNQTKRTTRIIVRLARQDGVAGLRQLEGVEEVTESEGNIELHTSRPPRTIVALVKHLESIGNELQSLEMASPSLEDVFIEVTGRSLRD